MTFCKAFNGQSFEIQVPQNVHDGNVDFRWSKGAVFTSKAEDIWGLQPGVTAEDVAHMQARCEMFLCAGSIRRRVGGVPHCRHHLAAWIHDGAAAFDARLAFAGPQPSRGAGSCSVSGLDALLEQASVPAEPAAALVSEIAALGAINVQELRPGDWSRLQAWASLRVMEQRRIMAIVRP